VEGIREGEVKVVALRWQMEIEGQESEGKGRTILMCIG
jgi:hypothetical protein